MITPSINNLSLDELENYTEELIRCGYYGPVVVAVLTKWSESAAKLEEEITTIRGLVEDIMDTCGEIKGMRNE